MEFTLVLISAVVQGITEFLPISSDGHLVVTFAIYEAICGRPVPDALGLEIVLHAGTLAAIVIYYWRQLWRLLGQDRRVIGLLVVGSLPAVLIGLPLHYSETAKQVLTSPLLAGLLLPTTGCLLLWGTRHQGGELDYRDMSYAKALIIGVFQALAILPGVSRSGSTISAALALGLRRESAATFSFLLAVPAVGGACVLELRHLLADEGAGGSLPQLAMGAGVSLVVGLFALCWLIHWLQRGRLQFFAYWCFGLGAVVTVWQLAI